MPRSIKWPKIDFSESNFTGAFLHLLSASLAISSLLSNEWIIVEESAKNNTSFDGISSELIFDIAARADKCISIGCRDFWRPARFGGFLDPSGKTHIAFHSDNKVFLDCVTPVVANLFYVLIAFCFVITITSTLSCVMNILPPPNGFLQWLKRNTILEMCNMLITLCVCVTAIVAQTEVDNMRIEEDVSLGSGVFVICLSGLFCFFAASSTLRHATRMNRMRRLDNQRILCARSLRSWRDAARRPEDATPIVDFERYLDSATSLSELAPSQHISF